MDIQFYALQLVEGSTVFVFLGTGLLEQDTGSLEDQYLVEICPLSILNKSAIRLLFPVFQATLQLVSARIY